MNIALGAIIIILLLLPAISFRFTITRNSHLKEFLNSVSITDSLWAFLIVPILTHLLSILILRQFWVIKLPLLYQLLIGDKDLEIQIDFSSDVVEFLTYICLTFLTGGFLGSIVLVLNKNQWISRNLFKFGNTYWNSFLKPEYIKKKTGRDVDWVVVDILSNNKENAIIYTGVVKEFYLKPKSKELDYIVLTEAFRRNLHKAKVTRQLSETTNFFSNEVGEIFEIESEFFIIPSSEILNINVRYIDLIFPSFK